jgi:thioredoxin-related protein
MNLKTVLALAAAFVLTLGVSACQKTSDNKEKTAVPGGTIAWMGYTEGMQKAKETGKPVMVDFYTSWCKYCKMLDDTTYQDPGIVEIINKDFVAIKIDAEGSGKVVENGKEMTEKDLASAFKVSGYPTIWFFNQKQEKIAPLSGYRSPEDFKPVLTYITSGSYAKGIEYGDYLKSINKK